MKFSVTIPAYKRRFFRECLESILQQSYKDFEIVIVDDASPEDLRSIVLEYSDDRIRYYRNEDNCGAVNVVDNWNKCLDYAIGEYLICMGDDDILQPWCLEEYAKLIEKYPGLGVYHAYTEVIDEKGDFKNVTVARPEYESVYSFIWHRWEGGRNQYIGDFLYDIRLLRENGGFYKLPLAWASDDITACVAAMNKGIANTQKVCFCYRKNSLTISNSGNSTIKLEAIAAEEEWYKNFLDKQPQDLQDIKFHKCIVNNLLTHFRGRRKQTLLEDFAGRSVFRVFYWIPKLKRYKLSFSLILIAAIKSR